MILEYFKKKQLRLLNSVPLKFIRKQYMKKIAARDRLAGLLGARGVGKTTLLLQYLKQHFQSGQSLYLIADDIIMANTSIYGIAEQFYALNGRMLIIDEIHKYPNWTQEIKNLYDSFPDLFIRFSGSSMLNILYEQYDLSRRAYIIQMNELTFREFLELKHDINLPNYTLKEIVKNSIDISNDLLMQYPFIYSEFQEYLKIGAYPFFVENIETYREKLFNALEKIIYEDIPGLKKIKFENLIVFKKLIFNLIEARVPYKVNISKLARELKITQPTLYIYLDILNQTKIFRSLKKYTKKISRKPQKLFFHNSNILYTFSSEFNIEVNIGTVRETFFVSCFDNIFYSDIGDFQVNQYIFEIGGKNKDIKQIKDVSDSFLVVDMDIVLSENKIPLWLFGFMK